MAPLRQQFARCGLRAAWSCAAMSLLACIAACGGGGSAGPSKTQSQVLSSLAVAITYDTMRVSEVARATVEGRDQAGAAMRIPDPTWTSSNPSVATVTYVGIVTAVGLGTTSIVASSAGKQGEVTVHVVPIAVAGVLLGPDGLVLAPGESKRFVASAIDAAGRPLPDRKIDWLSSDERVAIVSDDGLVAAVGSGVMSVSALSEGIYASVTVRVTGPAGPVAIVTVNPTAASLAIGQTRQLARYSKMQKATWRQIVSLRGHRRRLTLRASPPLAWFRRTELAAP